MAVSTNRSLPIWVPLKKPSRSIGRVLCTRWAPAHSPSSVHLANAVGIVVQPVERRRGPAEVVSLADTRGEMR